jgi:hypothetical protein
MVVEFFEQISVEQRADGVVNGGAFGRHGRTIAGAGMGIRRDPCHLPGI